MRNFSSDEPAAGYGWLDMLAALADNVIDLLLAIPDIIAAMLG